MDVRRLAPADDRRAFRSGNVELDRFFQRYAGENQFTHPIGVTYVAAEDRIVGFVTLAAASVEIERSPGRAINSDRRSCQARCLRPE